MQLWQILVLNLAVLLGVFTLLWLASLPLKNASIVDPFWGSGFVLISWLSYALGGDQTGLTLVLAVLVTVWGVRLSGYLLWRNWGEGEDRRYAAMREKHARRFPLVSLGTVFWLQATIAWVVALPLQSAFALSPQWRAWSWIGAALWATGLFFESVGDFQLARFKADPGNRGKVLDTGLWRYTRHPNYFGDFLVWWGLYLVAVTPANWWWTLVGPLLMSVLLMQVSGVTLLEKSLSERVGDYERYKRCTSSFFPLPRKSDCRPSA